MAEAAVRSPVIVDTTTGYNFMPSDDYFGDVIFSYIVSDGNGPGKNATFTMS